jgi:hypothetical protein
VCTPVLPPPAPALPAWQHPRRRSLPHGVALLRVSSTLASPRRCLPQDPHQEPVPAGDVDGAQWFPVAQLRGLKGGGGLLVLALLLRSRLLASCAAAGLGEQQKQRVLPSLPLPLPLHCHLPPATLLQTW